MKKKPIIYLSHSILGDGTLTMEENCYRATKVAIKLRKVFPEIEWHVPGEHDKILQILWRNKVITTEEILAADCQFLREECHGWAWWYTGESEGCRLEAEEAFRVCLTSTTRNDVLEVDLLKANYGDVRRLMTPIVEQAKARFYEL